MKPKVITFFFTVLMSMVGTKAFAHDFQKANVDGVTIYYQWTDDTHTAVEVTYRGEYMATYSNEYSGRVVIPAYVVYNGKTLPVTGIFNGAFLRCTGLTYVYIPQTVTRIGNSAFTGCTGLKSVRIPSSVTYIGDITFSECSGLTYVVIGNTNTKIIDDAFSKCPNLTDVYCYSKSVVNAEPQFFGLSNYNTNMTLHVPSGSITAYQNQTAWKRYFKNFVALKDDDPRIIGDVTGDGDVNATDIVEVANIILGKK